MDGKCNECRFFSELTKDAGECYRFPPAMIAVGKRIEMSRPTVSPNGSCGEYLPLGVPRPKA